MRVIVEGAEELAAAWDAAADRADDELKPVVSKGALNIKNAWRDGWRGFRHAPALPDAVSYDLDNQGGALGAEIGPDKSRRQGALGNLLEYGSQNNAPHPAGDRALDREGPRFEQAAGDVAEKIADV